MMRPSSSEDGSGPTRRNYRFNVAAYELDKLLGLNLVPPSVERTVNGRPASVTWWLDDFAMNELDRRRKGIDPPDPDRWGRQVQAVRVFDELISNTYRDTAPPLYLNSVWDNLLITTDWTIWIVDHTGAFRVRRELQDPDSLVRCPRTVLGRLRALNKDAAAAGVDKVSVLATTGRSRRSAGTPREALRPADCDQGRSCRALRPSTQAVVTRRRPSTASTRDASVMLD